jgi:hypothetical protein
MVGIVGGLTFTAMYKDNVAQYAAGMYLPYLRQHLANLLQIGPDGKGMRFLPRVRYCDPGTCCAFSYNHARFPISVFCFFSSEGGKASPHVYDDNFYAICAVICIGFFVALLIRTSMRDRMTPRQPGELLRVPCFGRV